VTIEVTSRSESQTLDLAARLARGLRGGEVIALEGELGAGKTCFVRGLAAGLGLDASAVCSPTFVICRRYGDSAALGLVHIDAFRLGGPQDLDSIGWEEMLAEPDSVIAVEWAGRIADALPRERLEIAIDHLPDGARRIRLTAPAELARLWVAESDGAACKVCGAPVAKAAETFPFCSRRCRLVDLGRWMDGRYAIPGGESGDAGDAGDDAAERLNDKGA
jgi:tRNA threonylcarbamoyladenosine biosynthesis protein TsaE